MDASLKAGLRTSSRNIFGKDAQAASLELAICIDWVSATSTHLHSAL